MKASEKKIEKAHCITEHPAASIDPRLRSNCVGQIGEQVAAHLAQSAIGGKVPLRQR